MPPANECHYAVLGVAPAAADVDITKAYRKLVLKYHPDKGGDTATFQKIQQAYDTLKDPIKKVTYDATIRTRVAQAARASTVRPTYGAAPFPYNAPFGFPQGYAGFSTTYQYTAQQPRPHAYTAAYTTNGQYTYQYPTGFNAGAQWRPFAGGQAQAQQPRPAAPQAAPQPRPAAPQPAPKASPAAAKRKPAAPAKKRQKKAPSVESSDSDTSEDSDVVEIPPPKARKKPAPKAAAAAAAPKEPPKPPPRATSTRYSFRRQAKEVSYVEESVSETDDDDDDDDSDEDEEGSGTDAEGSKS